MFRAVVAGVLCCGAVTAAHAQKDRERVERGHNGKVGVVNGELRVGKNLGSGWRFRETARGMLILYAGTARAWRGWYLNYDHRGKDPRVGLVPEPGPGCYWNWEEGAWKKNPNGCSYTVLCTARPANGPMRGWSLTCDGVKLVLAEGASAEVVFTGSAPNLRDDW